MVSGSGYIPAKLPHDLSHVKDFDPRQAPGKAVEIGESFARSFRKEKAIMGVFDEGCMGMFNAIIPDQLLHPTGIFKERLSQSGLYAAMHTIQDGEAEEVLKMVA